MYLFVLVFSDQLPSIEVLLSSLDKCISADDLILYFETILSECIQNEISSSLVMLGEGKAQITLQKLTAKGLLLHSCDVHISIDPQVIGSCMWYIYQ